MTYQIYTDGYFDMIDQVGASAVVILDENKSKVLVEHAKARKVEFDPGKIQRNNEQELGACIRAIMLLPKGSSCVIYSDSQYAVNVLNKTWGAKTNTVIIDRFFEEVAIRHIKVVLKWIRGHNGDVWNERADQLCEEAANDIRAGGRGYILSGEIS